MGELLWAEKLDVGNEELTTQWSEPPIGAFTEVVYLSEWVVRNRSKSPAFSPCLRGIRVGFLTNCVSKCKLLKSSRSLPSWSVILEYPNQFLLCTLKSPAITISESGFCSKKPLIWSERVSNFLWKGSSPGFELGLLYKKQKNITCFWMINLIHMDWSLFPVHSLLFSSWKATSFRMYKQTPRLKKKLEISLYPGWS